MKNVYRKGGAIGLAAAGMTLAFALPASATGGSDGLVDLDVGNVNILRDINVAAVVPVAANLCGINTNIPANLAILSAAAQNVDNTSQSYTVCKILGNDVKIIQN